MEKIKALISNGEPDEAIRLLDEYIAANPFSDEAFFLRGNAFRKKNNFQQSLTNYLTAMELNPDSPAHQAHNMLMDILNYYHKDRYNP